MLLLIEQFFIHNILILSLACQDYLNLNSALFYCEKYTSILKKASNANQDSKENIAELKLWGLPREKVEFIFLKSDLSTKLVEKKQHVEQLQFEFKIDSYEESKLTEEHLAFFDSISEIVNFIDEDENSDDMLSIDHWEENPVLTSEHLYKTDEKADAQIADYLIGLQKWVVEVVGEEQGYIHVSDGSGRVWLDAQQYSTFNRGDILLVLVNRETYHKVELVDITMLQEFSTDFTILDDVYNCTSNCIPESIISA